MKMWFSPSTVMATAMPGMPYLSMTGLIAASEMALSFISSAAKPLVETHVETNAADRIPSQSHFIFSSSGSSFLSAKGRMSMAFSGTVLWRQTMISRRKHKKI
ncbi:hypothetical protein FHT72_000694 [Rhizobium sp. BK077]|nr:hypothetical protein [Rhizobium sp. BK112]MBB3366240.1 hypothetical protein [Rhizobium sp. BK077]